LTRLRVQNISINQGNPYAFRLRAHCRASLSLLLSPPFDPPSSSRGRRDCPRVRFPSVSSLSVRAYHRYILPTSYEQLKRARIHPQKDSQQSAHLFSNFHFLFNQPALVRSLPTRVMSHLCLSSRLVSSSLAPPCAASFPKLRTLR
jgi:hypothetical protein